MAELSNELKAKLKQAQSLEEVTGMLQAAGQDVARAEKLWKELEDLHAQENKELSMDELDAVAGGVKHRDYLAKGCAATVEPYSDCWGTDGGCIWVNIEYSNPPRNLSCPYCSANPVARTKDLDDSIACRKCGKRFYNHGGWVEYVY